MIFGTRGELGNQLMFVIFMFLLVVIAGGIVAGVYMYNGAAYDVRQRDASILLARVVDCLASHPAARTDASSFYTVCKLDEAALNKYGYKLRICTAPGECMNDPAPFVTVGSNFQLCSLTYSENNNIPICVHRTLTLGEVTYTIISGSAQQSVGARI